MGTLCIEDMRGFLSRSISSFNLNKLHGMLAEIEFRRYIEALGFSDHVSVGGWLFRSTGEGNFGHHTVAVFPHTVRTVEDYNPQNEIPEPSYGLHTICATFHKLGIRSLYCFPRNVEHNDPESIEWYGIQLGIPTQPQYQPFHKYIEGFKERKRRYNFLRYKTDVQNIHDEAIEDEFSKESLRVDFQTRFFSEASDIDGILWGQNKTYPIEIKEKTPAEDNRLGPYFGLDVGPFVKLAFYAAKRGNLDALFVVREINNESERRLVQWLFITFEHLAQYASWVFRSGGKAMGGGASATVRIPRHEFTSLNTKTIRQL